MYICTIVHVHVLVSNQIIMVTQLSSNPKFVHNQYIETSLHVHVHVHVHVGNVKWNL